eukprot:944135-Rhodomonas_salina.2
MRVRDERGGPAGTDDGGAVPPYARATRCPVLRCAYQGGNKAKAKCHNGAITCATFNTEVWLRSASSSSTSHRCAV